MEVLGHIQHLLSLMREDVDIQPYIKTLKDPGSLVFILDYLIKELKQ